MEELIFCSISQIVIVISKEPNLRCVTKETAYVCAKKAMADHAVTNVYQVITITQIASNVIVRVLEVYRWHVMHSENVHV